MANKRSSQRSRSQDQFRAEVNSFLADLDEFAGEMAPPAMATETEPAVPSSPASPVAGEAGASNDVKPELDLPPADPAPPPTSMGAPALDSVSAASPWQSDHALAPPVELEAPPPAALAQESLTVFAPPDAIDPAAQVLPSPAVSEAVTPAPAMQPAEAAEAAEADERLAPSWQGGRDGSGVPPAPSQTAAGERRRRDALAEVARSSAAAALPAPEHPAPVPVTAQTASEAWVGAVSGAGHVIAGFASGRPWTLAAAMEVLPPLAPPPARPSVAPQAEIDGSAPGPSHRIRTGLSPWLFMALAVLIVGVLIALLVVSVHH